MTRLNAKKALSRLFYKPAVFAEISLPGANVGTGLRHGC
ncbi:hypothetical protein PAMC26577_29270 [Caballeronia sordidicola]|uniref:Uncharacterized protein n=1 Tax=Caballeronia sordidicola TaxID=196367 RepID=A0A242MF88_CABSO|nr:hypothetical protein PAMC26577_29270 [Caballeronia sordidicola]